MSEKIFAVGAYGLKRNFSNGGSKTELDLKWEDFKAWAETQVNDRGYVKLEIQGSREPRMDDKGNERLNVSLNNWQPQGQTQAPQQPMQGVAPQYAPPQQPLYNQPQAPQQPMQPQAPQQPMQPQQPIQQPQGHAL